MSWFFFKGGMMYKETDSKTLISKSSKRLLVPYLIFILLGMFLEILFFQFDYNVPPIPSILRGGIVEILQTTAVYPTFAVWFLISLFFARIVFNLLFHKLHSLLITVLFAFASYAIYIIFYNGWTYDVHVAGTFHLQFPQFYLGNMCHGLSLYSLGYYLKDKQFNKNVFVIASIMFVMKYFIPSGIDFRANLSSGANFMLAVLYGMTGCIVINNFFKRFLNYKISFVTHIGDNSMVYYLVHFPVMVTVSQLYLRYRVLDFWHSFFILFLTVTISLLIAEWIFRHKKLRFIIGG